MIAQQILKTIKNRVTKSCCLYIKTHYIGKKWGRGGVVFSALDFRSEGRSFDAQACHRVVSLDKLVKKKKKKKSVNQILTSLCEE